MVPDLPPSPFSPTPSPQGAIPRPSNPKPVLPGRKDTPSEQRARFEREKERLKEVAVALDRDQNIIKRTRGVENNSTMAPTTDAGPSSSAVSVSTVASAATTLIGSNDHKEDNTLEHLNVEVKNKAVPLPNPQPQISTPVPSSGVKDKKTPPGTKRQDQRNSTMTDTQIMEKLRK